MSGNDDLLNSLQQAVLDNLQNEQFGVNQLSQIAGLSRSHLHRKLKKLKSQSISQFIREVRLQEAHKLLQKNTITISEIAYKVGFGSTSYFHKCFHEYYGYSPSEAKKYLNKETFKQTIEKKKSISFNNQTLKIVKIIGVLATLFFVGYLMINHFSKNEVLAINEKSIAVLPFKNISGDEENQFFADGLVEGILNRLATLKEFKVISRTSSEIYKHNTTKTIPTIASELGVSYILEGSVQRHEKKTRITVQLIDATHDDHVWIKSFDRELSDIFDVQSEVALQIASGLNETLSEEQTLEIKRNQTENLEAYKLYQLGRFYWGKRLKKDYATAIDYFHKAIEEDSNYATAYAGLGDTYFLKTWTSSTKEEIIENRKKAEYYALKAIELDPNLLEAHTVLATLYFYIDWEWEKANHAFTKAFEIGANYSTLHHRYSEYLSCIGEHKKARLHINKALELDPLSYIVREVSAKLYLNRGQFHEAIEESKIAGDLNKDHMRPPLYQFWGHYMLKNNELALESLKELRNVIKNNTTDEALNSIFKTAGRDGLMEWCIDNIYNKYFKIKSLAFWGENEKVMNELEEFYNSGGRLADVPYWYSPNNLKSHPKFITLMKKMNLPYNTDSLP
ncbi:helix-turn-helix domain-containing protein [Seonamhaeicola aphaedonensis]|uniref:TolB-like protein n=1 Tax=Seonamhaeicola aphaedonensis TaxID=1461338 RepID=A0A3D9HEL8_9FLAO|nr:helix-turn-helix domain-containing protein [Seonamhaeicola aphaedonensis]RED47927.1 TolB-like protein [Seonamhaeicola aphaedonensis]